MSAEAKSGDKMPTGARQEEESGIPEELHPVWSYKVAEAFRALEPKQRVFILAYVRKWNGSEAYREAYNPLANDGTAAACGSRLLANANVKAVLGAFLDTQTEDLLLVKQTYVEAARTASKPIFGKDSDGQPILVLEQADHDVRIKAAQALAKLHGLNAPDKTEHSGTVTLSIAEQIRQAHGEEAHGSADA